MAKGLIAKSTPPGAACHANAGRDTNKETGMSVRVINGFGRIGRDILRAIVEAERHDIEVVAVNDLATVETNAHLLRYDFGARPHPRSSRMAIVRGRSRRVGRSASSRPIRLGAEAQASAPLRCESPCLAKTLPSAPRAWNRDRRFGLSSAPHSGSALRRRWLGDQLALHFDSNLIAR